METKEQETQAQPHPLYLDLLEHENPLGVDVGEFFRESVDEHIPALASICDYMMLRTRQALLGHDLDEAIFWNTGLLVARMVERIDFDLSCFENHKAAERDT